MTTNKALTPEAPLDCALCPRLRTFLDDHAQKEPDWFNSPVPSFGEGKAELLVIGLAPGLGGANRTGRPFTGDWAGDLLYKVIDEFDLSHGTYDARPDDGLKLNRTMITNAVRCVPPENKPNATEINTCRPFLIDRIESLKNLKVMITLGKISHDSTIRALGLKLKDHPFGHGNTYKIEKDGKASTHLIASYHCSRYNTNTGRLTEDMFRDIFKSAKALIDKG